MIWQNHSNRRGGHAILSPSQYSWVNYTKERLEEVYHTKKAAALGTRLHNLAAELITLAIRLPETTATLNMFVNDAIRYKMEPELVLFYSEYCFGTADAISFRDNVLRISDLKTGVTPASMTQLEIYAALFCLEYDKNPNDIVIELRIYQNDAMQEFRPSGDSILRIMSTIVEFDKYLSLLDGVS